MAKLEDSQNAQEILKGEGQSLEEYSKARIDRQEKLALAELSKFTPDGFGDFFSSEKIGEFGSAKKTTEAVKTQVATILENTSEQFQKGMNMNSFQARIESHVWANRQSDVHDRIVNVAENANSSLLVAQGYAGFLKQSKSVVEERWKKGAKQYHEILAQSGVWKNWGEKAKFGMGNFSEKFEAQLHLLFAEMESRTKKIASDSKERISQAKNILDDKFSAAEASEEARNTLAETVHNAHEGAFDKIDWAYFGVRDVNSQEAIDFLELFQKDERILQGGAAVEESGKKSKEQEKAEKELTDLEKKQKEFLEGSNNFRFEELMKTDEFKELSPLVNPVKLETLVSKLEEELGHSEVKIADLYKDEDKFPLSLKLLKLVGKLMDDASLRKKLSLEARQMLFMWIQGEKAASEIEAEQYDEGKAKEAVKKLREGNDSVVSKANACIKAAKKIDGTVTTGDPLSGVGKQIDDFSKLTFKGHQEFENIQEKIHPTLRAELQKMWDKVIELRKKLQEFLTTREEELKKWKKWEKQKTERRNERDDAISELSGVRPREKEEFSVLVRLPQEIRTNYQNFLSTEPEFSSVDFSDFSGLLGTWESLKLEVPKTLQENVSLNERIRRKFAKEGVNPELEQDFLGKMQKNDQYRTLTEATLGAKVSLQFRDHLEGEETLSFPSALGDKKTENLSVVRKNKKGVCLENEAFEIVVLGPSVEEKQGELKPHRNIVIRPRTGGENRLGMIFNLEIT